MHQQLGNAACPSHGGDSNADAMNDIAVQVVQMMNAFGAAGLPRNYELFYEAATGTDKELHNRLKKLGNSASQEDLDALGRRYFAHHHGQGVMEEARVRMASQVTEVLTLLRREQASLQNYGKVLGATSQKISGHNGQLLNQIVKLLSDATNAIFSHSKKVVTSMNETSAEIHNIQIELDRYKKLANTDSLTRLAKRRAFDAHIATIGSDKKAAMYSALATLQKS